MLARSVLRWAVVEALRPFASLSADDNPPAWPTIAGRHVYDSRLDPIEDLAADQRRPIVIVYTEVNRVDRLGQHGRDFNSRVDLTFELSVVGADEIDGNVVAGVAYTDAGLEATLDLLEDQVFQALTFHPGGGLFRKVIRRLEGWQSTPHRSSEEGLRLAVRTVVASYDLQPLCYNIAAGAGIERLPQPLRDVVEALPPETYSADIVAGLAPSAPWMPTLHPLNSVSLDIEPKSPPASPGGADRPRVIAEIGRLQET